MKNRLLQTTLLLLFSFQFSAFGQQNVLEIQNSVAEHRYYAYLLANNKLVAMLENRTCQSFFLTTDNGTLERDSINPCKYKFRPTKYRRANIFYCELINGDTSIIQQEEIYVRPWPFTATLKHRTGYFSMTKHDIINAPLRVEALNTGLSAALPIKSFRLTVKRNNKLIYNKEFQSYKRELFVRIGENLSIIEKGDIIIYSDIVYNYSGYQLNANDLIITVK